MPRVRWGLWDVVLAYLVGVLVTVPVVGAWPDVTDRAVGVFVLVLAQDLPWLAYCVGISRAKGLGSLAADFGFVVRLRDWPWLLYGLGWQVLTIAALQPLASLFGRDEPQKVAELAERATGPSIALIAVAVVLVAPVLEELLFRGVLLRALLRRTTPAWAIFASSLVFGAVHLLDGSVGSVIALPGLVGVGVLSAVQARRTGDLSRSILLHVGFNALAAVGLFVGAGT